MTRFVLQQKEVCCTK